MPGYANPQNLNRYSYTVNNPLLYTDPTGHRPCGDEETISCETGLLNNPPDHANTGCGGPGQHSCLGNSPTQANEDEAVPDLLEILNDLLGSVVETSGIPILIPMESPDFTINPAIWTPRGPRDWEALARKLGMTRKGLTGNVESCKQTAGVPPDGNVQIDDETGDIYYRGEHIGNARDGC